MQSFKRKASLPAIKTKLVQPPSAGEKLKAFVESLTSSGMSPEKAWKQAERLNIGGS